MLSHSNDLDHVSLKSSPCCDSSQEAEKPLPVHGAVWDTPVSPGTAYLAAVTGTVVGSNGKQCLTTPAK